MDPVLEDLLLRDSLALETEVAIPTASPKLTTSIAMVDEPEVPIADLSMEPTQLSSFLAITQGNYRPKVFSFLLHGDLLD